MIFFGVRKKGVISIVGALFIHSTVHLIHRELTKENSSCFSFIIVDDDYIDSGG